MSAHPVYLETRDYMPAIRQRLTGQAPNLEAEAPCADDDVTPRPDSIYARADRILFRAMLNGTLTGWFRDGSERCEVPGWAWADQGGDANGLMQGYDFLHTLLPPKWRRWARLPVSIERSEFENWLGSGELEDQSGFPDLPVAHDEIDRPPHIEHQDLPTDPTVSLSHAVSWLAFGISMDAATLLAALSADAFGSDLALVDRKMKHATERLVTAGTGGLPFFGKFVPVGADYGAALTERIDTARLEDFRQFDVIYDGLRYGTGLRYDFAEQSMIALNHVFPSPDRRYIHVKVERIGLTAITQLTPNAPQPISLGRPRELNPDHLRAIAAELIKKHPGISRGSTAASIIADLPLNSKTGKPRDSRGIERIIAPLWEGKKT